MMAVVAAKDSSVIRMVRDLDMMDTAQAKGVIDRMEIMEPIRRSAPWGRLR